MSRPSKFDLHSMLLQERIDHLRSSIKFSYQDVKGKLSKPSPNTACDETTKQPDAPASPETCHLLRLPREIRDRIWEYCVGGHVIHINNPSMKKITHIICRAPFTELTIHHASSPFSKDADDEDRGYLVEKWPPGQRDRVTTSLGGVKIALGDAPASMADHGYRHSTCAANSWNLASPNLTNPKATEAIKNEQLPLSLLRTSRLVYAEAFQILWTRNTFAFAKGPTFASFVRSLTTRQRQTLRHISLKTENPIRIPYLRVYASSSQEFGSRNSVLGPPYGATKLYAEGLRGLPALRSVYIATGVDVPAEVLERVWCDAQLVIERGGAGERGKTNGIDAPAVSEQECTSNQQAGQASDAGGGVEVLAELRHRPLLSRFTLHVENLWHKDYERSSVTFVSNEMITWAVGLGLEAWVRGDFGPGVDDVDEEDKGQQAEYTEGQDVVRLVRLNESQRAVGRKSWDEYLALKMNDAFWRAAHPN